MSEVTPEAVETYVIVVNGQEKPVHSHEVTWDHVVDLAFPGERENPAITFVVTYSDAEGHPQSGLLEKGGAVKVERRGTSFNVAKHPRS
jgi:hypothetical protein